ncbi:MAG TPA: glycerophosphodiester phosphodiesterase family protein, partial [Candidatus Binatia bacterium]|nr:glycerophosphodiester phosphodiesterase family protein [Candidatus Binatia bacterium]
MRQSMTPLTQALLSTALPCWVIGHRGALARCPENTLPSFLTARDAGACMLELDVQQSTDGKLFVFHDDTLERLCAEETQVASLAWEALSTKVIGHWQGQPLKIPLLVEVFTTLQRSVFYNIELKTDTVPYPDIEVRLNALVRAYGLTERVLVSSFHHDSLRLVQQTNANLLRGLLCDSQQAQHFGSPEGVVARAQELTCFSVHPYFPLLRSWPTLVETCHTAGLRIFPWTVDDPQDWRFLVDDL